MASKLIENIGVTELLPTWNITVSGQMFKNNTEEAFGTLPLSNISNIDKPTAILPIKPYVPAFYNLYMASFDTKFYSLPFIMLPGIFFNILAMAVILYSPLHKTTPGHYLVALAVADNAFLLGESLSWFYELPFRSMYIGRHDAICGLIYTL